jgi:hypothetical protein
MLTTLLWLVACGPALIGLLARRVWVTALLIVLNAAVVAMIVWMPQVALLGVAALYALALALVVNVGRPPVDEVVVEKRIRELRRLLEHQYPL